jgi:hypothetical protein
VGKADVTLIQEQGKIRAREGTDEAEQTHDEWKVNRGRDFSLLRDPEQQPK